MQKLIRKLRLYAQYTISCAFALFGLVNPKSKIDVLNIFLFTFLITYQLYFYRKRNRAFLTIWVLTLFAALFSYFVYLSEYLTLASLFALAGVIYFFILKGTVKNLNKIFVAHLIIFFLVSSYINSHNLRSVIAKEPAPKIYFNDYLAYLRIFYLVEKDVDYYTGFVTVHTEDGRSSTIPQKTWNWRLPTYAYLWKIFPGTGGLSVYIVFLVISSAALYFSYRIGRVFLNSKQAILIPYILFPYFHFAARDLSSLSMEWWALPFLILTVFAIVKKRLNLLFISSAIAMILRELFLIPVLLWIVSMVISKNYKMVRMLTFAMVIFFIALALHYFKVTQYIPRSRESVSFGSRPFELTAFQQTLSYGSVDYLFFRFRPFLVSLVFSGLLLAFGFFKKRLSFSLLIMPLAALSTTIFALKFASKDADYWGVSYIPFLLMSFVIFAMKIVSQDEKA